MKKMNALKTRLAKPSAPAHTELSAREEGHLIIFLDQKKSQIKGK